MKGRYDRRVFQAWSPLVFIVLGGMLLPITARPGMQRNEDSRAMVFVRGGTIAIGIDDAEIPRFARIFGVSFMQLFQDELPKHQVSVADFFIDKYLVTNSRFKKFVNQHPEWRPGKLSPELDHGNYLNHWSGGLFSPGKADDPVVNVNWYAAVAYCQSFGKRLPSEAEWEHAARGRLSSPIFPWGNESVSPMRANYSGSKLHTTTRVGSYPPNGYGIYDMAGNVWEFTADEWSKYPSLGRNTPLRGSPAETHSPYLEVRTRRVIRGGSFDGDPVNLWVEYRDSHPPNGSQPYVGFRCAK